MTVPSSPPSDGHAHRIPAVTGPESTLAPHHLPSGVPVTTRGDAPVHASREQAGPAAATPTPRSQVQTRATSAQAQPGAPSEPAEPAKRVGGTWLRLLGPSHPPTTGPLVGTHHWAPAKPGAETGAPTARTGRAPDAPAVPTAGHAHIRSDQDQSPNHGALLAPGRPILLGPPPCGPSCSHGAGTPRLHLVSPGLRTQRTASSPALPDLRSMSALPTPGCSHPIQVLPGPQFWPKPPPSAPPPALGPGWQPQWDREPMSRPHHVPGPPTAHLHAAGVLTF